MWSILVIKIENRTLNICRILKYQMRWNETKYESEYNINDVLMMMIIIILFCEIIRIV